MGTSALRSCYHRRREQSRRRIVVVGDVHGCLAGLCRVLRMTGLIDERQQWQAGADVQLLLCGDMVDEGAASCGAVKLVRSLQGQAGPNVIALMGNHELLLLRALAGEEADLQWETVWSWADEDPVLGRFLAKENIPRLTTPQIQRSFLHSCIASGSVEYPPEYVAKCNAIAKETTLAGIRLFRKVLERDGTLAWLEALPAAKRIGRWGFFHGGPPSGFLGGIDQLNEAFTALLQARKWDHCLLAPYGRPESPVSTRGWMNGGEAAVDRLLAEFDLARVAFGHSPGAINGVFGRLAQRWGKVFKADTYFSLGIEGCLEILDDSVWAMYTPESRWIYGRLHPQRAPLPELELLWPSA
ncbi:MAG: metallophosphoesterase [Limnochordia bacterium]|jgi:hypothetical protein